MPLTQKQQFFVAEYTKDFNGTRSAIAAGYSERTAKSIASELLRNTEIQAAIAEAVKARIERVQIDADWVLKKATQVLDRCMQIEPVFDRKGRHVFTETAEGTMAPAFIFDSKGALMALALIGKLTNVNAFVGNNQDKNSGSQEIILINAPSED